MITKGFCISIDTLGLFALCFCAAFLASSLYISDLLEVALEQSAPIRGSSSSTSSISFLSTFKEEVGNAAQKHKAKRVESVNDDVEAFGDHRESSDCSMHSKAEALEHMKKRDTGHQTVSLENITGDSTVLRIGDSAKVVIKQDMKGG